MGKGINFGSGGGFKLPTPTSGYKYTLRKSPVMEDAIELYNEHYNSAIVFNKNFINVKDYHGYWVVPYLSSYGSNQTDNMYAKYIKRFGITNLQIKKFVSTTDNGDETFATYVFPLFVFLQEVNTDIRLKLTNVDKSNKTFTITRDDASGEEITFYAFIIS